MPYPIALFITPHGFGHAARASALLAAWRRRQPDLALHLFTTVPKWLFVESAVGPFVRHPLICDVGLVQTNALTEDMDATLERLGAFFPLDPIWVAQLARQVRQLGCKAVLCDIAPLGIAVAQAAALPAILVENFTWDFIYAGYVAGTPEMATYVEILADLLQGVDLHIQAEPICRPVAGTVGVPPISRSPRRSRQETRRQLGVEPDRPLLLVTMGGAEWAHTEIERFGAVNDLTFVLPSQDPPPDCPPNLICLPRNSGLYHPDLIQASDGVAGKIGYSTLAEVYQAGIPYGYVSRPRFRESQHLVAFAQTRMAGFAISEEDFQKGDWLAQAQELISLPKCPREDKNGADLAAEQILNFLQ